MQNISELIEKLQKLQDLFGDVEIYDKVNVEVLNIGEYGVYDKNVLFINLTHED